MWPFKSKSKPTPGPLPAAVQQLARSQVVTLTKVEGRHGKSRSRLTFCSVSLRNWLYLDLEGPPELAQHLGVKVRVTLEPVED